MKKTIALTTLLLAAALNVSANDAISTSVGAAGGPGPSSKEPTPMTPAQAGKLIVGQLIDIANMQRQMLQLTFDKRQADSKHECVYNDHVYTDGAVVDMAGQKKVCSAQRPIIDSVVNLVWVPVKGTLEAY